MRVSANLRVPGRCWDRTRGKVLTLAWRSGPLVICPRSSLPVEVLTWLVRRLAHLAPPVGAEIHSCSSLVLAQETAEQIVSMYPAFASLMDRVRAGGWIRRSEPERPMRPMNVVMLDADARHLLQVSASHDQ
jgi:hypothetical protein